MIPDMWSVERDESAGVLVITVSGVLTYDDFVQFLSTRRSDPAFRDIAKNLWDLRHVTGYLSTSEINRLAAFVRSETVLPSRIVFVVNREVLFGLARMFEMLSERPGVERRVFRDYEQARAWLLEAESPTDLP